MLPFPFVGLTLRGGVAQNRAVATDDSFVAGDEAGRRE
jgi:hypothetical protein